MPDLTVAADETAATELMRDAMVSFGNFTQSGTSPLGPFNAGWVSSGYFTNSARVDLRPPDIIRLERCMLHYTLKVSLSLDLNKILNPIHIPGFSFTIKIGKWIKIKINIPGYTIYWPHVTIPFSYSDKLNFGADWRLHTYPAGPNWNVDAEIVAIPVLQFGGATAAVLGVLGLAAAAVLAPIPFIGPFLSVAVAGITGTIGIAGVTGFLGAALTPLISGATFKLYQQPRLFTVIPAGTLPLDPAVRVYLESLRATIIGTNEDELVFLFEIS